MSFLAPWGWILALLLPVVVLFYLLRTRRPRVEVSTLLFWNQIQSESRPRAVWRKLRHPFSLLLWLLMVTLLIGALTRPVFLQSTPETIVVLLDNRLRMQAEQPGGQSAWREAIQVAENLGPRGERPDQTFYLVQLTDFPSKVAGPVHDERSWRAALAEIQPSHGSGRWEEAVELAGQILAGQEEGEARVVSITGPQAPIAIPGDADHQWFAVGQAAPQVALTEFVVRPSHAQPGEREVVVVVENFGREPWSGDLETFMEDRRILVRPMEVDAGEREVFALPLPPMPQTGRAFRLEARLVDAPGLEAGHHAYAMIPPVEVRRVLVLGEVNRFLESALRAHPNYEFEQLHWDRFQPGMETGFDVLVVEEDGPELEALHRPVLVWNPERWRSGESVTQPWVETFEEFHPVTRRTRLDILRIAEASPIDLAPGWVALAGTDGQPLLAAGYLNEPEQSPRAVVVGFDLLRSDWVLRTSFPLFLEDALEWLTQAEAGKPWNVRVGQPVVLPSEWEVAVGPGETPQESPWSDHFFIPSEPGFHALRGSAQSDWLASNRVGRTEFEALAGQAESMEISVSQEAAQRAGPPALWFWLAGIGLVLLMVESWTYHRGITE